MMLTFLLRTLKAGPRTSEELANKWIAERGGQSARDIANRMRVLMHDYRRLFERKDHKWYGNLAPWKLTATGNNLARELK